MARMLILREHPEYFDLLSDHAPVPPIRERDLLDGDLFLAHHVEALVYVPERAPA